MSFLAKGSSQDVFSKPAKKRGEPYIFEKGLYKKIYNPSNSQDPPTVTVVCQMKNCNKRFENQKIKHSTSNYLQHYRRSHKSMNIDLLLREQIEDPFNFHLSYQSESVVDQFETQRSPESPHITNKISARSTQNQVQSDVIYIRSDGNSESSPSEETHSHSSLTQSNQHPTITSQNHYLDPKENQQIKSSQLEKSFSLSGKRKESTNIISNTNTNGKIRKLITNTECLTFETSEDALLAARDLIIHAYSLTTERTEQGKILDLLQIFRQYTENGYFNKDSSITARRISSFENAFRKIDTTDRDTTDRDTTDRDTTDRDTTDRDTTDRDTTDRDTTDRDTNQSSVPKSIDSPEIDKDIPSVPIPHYGSLNTSEPQELTILEKRNYFPE